MTANALGYRSLNRRQGVRADIWDACGGKCHYCGCELHPFRDFEIDHYVALCAGGEETVENLVGSCISCNRGKSSRFDRPASLRRNGAPWCISRVALKRIMDERGIGPQPLSRMSGITDTAIRNILNGRVLNPAPNTLRQLSAALGVTIPELMMTRDASEGEARTLRADREAAGMSLRQLSDAAGVAFTTIHQIELGLRQPQFRTMRKLRQALKQAPAGERLRDMEGGG